MVVVVDIGFFIYFLGGFVEVRVGGLWYRRILSRDVFYYFENFLGWYF